MLRRLPQSGVTSQLAIMTGAACVLRLGSSSHEGHSNAGGREHPHLRLQVMTVYSPASAAQAAGLAGDMPCCRLARPSLCMQHCMEACHHSHRAM